MILCLVLHFLLTEVLSVTFALQCTHYYVMFERETQTFDAVKIEIIVPKKTDELYTSPEYKWFNNTEENRILRENPACVLELSCDDFKSNSDCRHKYEASYHPSVHEYFEPKTTTQLPPSSTTELVTTRTTTSTPMTELTTITTTQLTTIPKINFTSTTLSPKTALTTTESKPTEVTTVKASSTTKTTTITTVMPTEKTTNDSNVTITVSPTVETTTELTTTKSTTTQLPTTKSTTTQLPTTKSTTTQLPSTTTQLPTTKSTTTQLPTIESTTTQKITTTNSISTQLTTKQTPKPISEISKAKAREEFLKREEKKKNRVKIAIITTSALMGGTLLAFLIRKALDARKYGSYRIPDPVAETTV